MDRKKRKREVDGSVSRPVSQRPHHNDTFGGSPSSAQKPCPCNVCWAPGGHATPQNRQKRYYHKRSYGLHPQAGAATEAAVVAVRSVLDARTRARSFADKGSEAAVLQSPSIEWRTAVDTVRGWVRAEEPGDEEVAPLQDVATYESEWAQIMEAACEVGLGDTFGLGEYQSSEYGEQPANALSTMFSGMAQRLAEDMTTRYYIIVIHFNIIIIPFNILLIGSVWILSTS